MDWRSGLKASAFALLFAFASPLAGLSEPCAKTNYISSVHACLAQGSISFVTGYPLAFKVPKCQFLPGPNGKILLVADFPNLFYAGPSQLMTIAGQDKDHSFTNSSGGQTIHFGQLQTFPAIFRIAISANNSEQLKAISFRAKAGLLTVSWPTSRAEPFYKSNSPKISENCLEKNSVPSCHQPLTLVFSTARFDREEHQLSNPANNVTMVSVPSNAHSTSDLDTQSLVVNAEKTTADASTDPLSTASSNQAAIPRIEIENLINKEPGYHTPNPNNLAVPTNDRLMVRVSANQKLNCICQRLHAPERYVVDFIDLPLLTYTNLPEPLAGSICRSIHMGMPLGTPTDKPTFCRLVFELTSSQCMVHKEIAAHGTQLELTFERCALSPWSISLPTSLQIILDPGHGGSDPGSQREGVQEKDITLAIANNLRRLLESKGIKVILTRCDDTFVSLADRVKLTNAISPDLFLSIHINSLNSDSDIHGIETYYQTNQSKVLARTIHDTLVNDLAVPDRSVRKARFYVINHTATPAILAEVGFISCQKEKERLISSDYQDRIAQSLAAGVILYFAKQTEVSEAQCMTGGKLLTVQPTDSQLYRDGNKQLAENNSINPAIRDIEHD